MCNSYGVPLASQCCCPAGKTLHSERRRRRTPRSGAIEAETLTYRATKPDARAAPSEPGAA